MIRAPASTRPVCPPSSRSPNRHRPRTRTAASSARTSSSYGHLPTGHREPGESTLACLVREYAEETGLTVAPTDLRLVHTLDHLAPDSLIPRIQMFFTATHCHSSHSSR
ncbi:NUDIX domain-containing protein [Streptomyces sp. Q6]|uniref:NUDIX domain-containing protein n=1 Tax=Streptomyces citrinus TaxID=3118173 RepID=A0ACD5AKE8_9ACTN